MRKNDVINQPTHYASTMPSVKVECIDFAKDMNFCQGNAFKYVWRAGHKDDASQDLQKAIWYLNKSEQQRLNISERVNTRAWTYVFEKLCESVNSEAECLRLRVLDLIANSFYFEARVKTEELIKLLDKKEL